MGLEKAIEQGDITHMSKYVKLSKTNAGETTSSGPLPYEMPDIQEKNAPSIVSTTTPAVESHITDQTGSEVSSDSHDAWEQYRRVMSRDGPTTMLAGPTNLKGNTRAAKHNLRDE